MLTACSLERSSSSFGGHVSGRLRRTIASQYTIVDCFATDLHILARICGHQGDLHFNGWLSFDDKRARPRPPALALTRSRCLLGGIVRLGLRWVPRIHCAEVRLLDLVLRWMLLLGLTKRDSGTLNPFLHLQLRHLRFQVRPPSNPLSLAAHRYRLRRLLPQGHSHPLSGPPLHLRSQVLLPPRLTLTRAKSTTIRRCVV